MATLPPVFELTHDQRELLREHTAVIARELTRHLEGSDPESAAQRLESAALKAELYGRVSASLCLSLSQTLEEFLCIRVPIQRDLALSALARGLNAAEAGDLLRSSEVGMDVLLASASIGYRSRSSRT